MTVEDFEQLAELDHHTELEDGELVAAEPIACNHGRVAARMGTVLAAAVRNCGDLYVSTGAVISRNPAVVRAPDLSFVRTQRLAHQNGDLVEGAPDLAVEIVSPTESAARLRRKVREYLSTGGRYVWLVYPEEREVHVWESGATVRILSGDDVIEAPDLLPGFATPVSAFFE